MSDGLVALLAGTDASGANWFPLNYLHLSVFDRRKIAECAHQRLQNKLFRVGRPRALSTRSK